METLLIKTQKSNAKLILEIVKKLGDTGKILSKKEKSFLTKLLTSIEESNDINEKSPYDPNFVKKIKSRERNARGKKLTRVNPDDVWANI